MKRFLMTLALTSVLSGTVMAGEVPSVGVTAPPPDETSIPIAPGDIPASGLTQQVSEAAFGLVQLLISAVA